MNRQTTALKMRDAVSAIVASAQQTHRANVVGVSPLTLELLEAKEGDALLEIDDDFDLTGTIRLLVKTVPLKVDDTVLLHKHRDHYALFDVLTDSTI